ncbi:MAG: hypothetical protein ABIH00_06750 [Armatimonadota bacterium]
MKSVKTHKTLKNKQFCRGAVLIEAFVIAVLLLIVLLGLASVCVVENKTISYAGDKIQAKRLGHSVLETYKNTYNYDELPADATTESGNFTCKVKVLGEVSPNIKLLTNKVTWIKGKYGGKNEVEAYMYVRKE